jgi:hypothetical protein
MHAEVRFQSDSKRDLSGRYPDRFQAVDLHESSGNRNLGLHHVGLADR